MTAFIPTFSQSVIVIKLITLLFRVYTLIRKRVAQRIILFKFLIDVNIFYKGGLLMKNSWKKVSLIAFIVIVLLIILYFGGISLFWNQP
ncbi:hypothetical protein COD78_03860 [Bacillus cereus]|uniref:Uncharacterized protein n=2 Tax=Bacillus cereus group TaxID=86661 RepID=A0A9X6ZEA1_BACCE|nr:hypothetical protein [Bacillus thuringiensis]OTW80900.1 hypothetical protein BK713_17240 [Bacillus thuringiensis serovar jinghongiensis]OTX18844.1 hypothetical protein BK715_09725 [Bacillus thuringiensis serovar japonensis]OTY81991.1 hypothetical protein BK754_32145 [Bacillus thuringiensis serovar subtoxicus]PDZ20816.1 hypothetical protein CON41_22525 [Bacillus cereus]RGP96715.1 hypothetical protein D1166_28485 [Bacillus sp. ISO11]